MLRRILVAWLVVPAARWSAVDEVEVVERPPVDGVNPFYAGRRAPLTAEPLVKLPVGAVRARGWLLEQLERMRDGMFGRLPELSHWCRPEGSAWRSRDGSGENGWEELPYWLKGFTSLAFLLDEGDRVQVPSPGDRGGAGAGGGARPAVAVAAGSESLVPLAVEWLEAIVASQREDGYFGPEANRREPDLWPNMPVLWAMRTWHEASGDPRILDFLNGYLRWQLELPPDRLLPGSWQKVRGGDNLDVVHWLYDRTGEPWLLELARRIHERTVDWTGGIASFHGVNFCQGFREPMQFFAQSREARHRDATLRDYAEMMGRFGQVPGGMFGADENCRDGRCDPRQAAEACSMVEFMLSFEMLGAQTGDAVWFDRCEDVAFNSLPAATDARLRALHYLTAPNLAACDAKDHQPGFQNGGCMLAFSPDERYRCCQHNVAHGWPFFAERLWFATRDRGLAAAMLAPCRVWARAGDGVSVSIEVQTQYPASDLVVAVVEPARPARFPLYFRAPGWCESLEMRVGAGNGRRLAAAGRFVRVEREWKPGDQVELRLPMSVRVRRFPENKDFAAVDRGPLTYSLAIRERWARAGGSDRWPDWEVVAESPWNYALVLDPGDPGRSLRDPEAATEEARSSNAPAAGERALAERVESALEGRDFLSMRPPALLARGRRVPPWKLDPTGLVAPLQRSPVRTDEPEEDLVLVPMGAARLRISAFPVAGSGPGAHEWSEPPPPPRASHVHDDPLALNDGILPRNSIDPSVPRFTFWDHVGTVEWVQYDFELPRRVSRSAVYWFDDTGVGRCRVPKSWRLLWLDGETWREVEGASGYGLARDRLNEVAFTPLTTRSLRLEVTLQPDVSAGLFEWTVGN